MEASKYLKDIQDIKEMMSKSTQFISLSGLSGVLAGIYALGGAAYANFLINTYEYTYITLESKTFKLIVLTAFTVLLFSVGTAYYLTVKKASKLGEKVWNTASKRVLINFAIPVITGGIFALLLVRQQNFVLIPPVTLLFYGLACLNASKYTLRDVRYLGITQIVLGLLAVEFTGYGLLFWVLGFGIAHILYGSIMYFKYDRVQK